MAKPAREMTDLERLVAIDAIHDLKARRDHAVDTKDWVAFAALHAEEHVSETAAKGRTVGGQATTEATARALAGISSTHHSHSPIIAFESSESATGVWAMEDHLFWRENDILHALWGSGFYHERYVKRGGRWLFIYRRLDRLHVTAPEGTKLSRLAFDRTSQLPAPEVW